MKRRDFLKTGVKLGVAMNALTMMMGPSAVRALGRSPLRGALQTLSTKNNNVLVVIQLAGGNDGLNTLVPVADTTSNGNALSLYKQLRPTLGLDLSKDNLIKLSDYDSLAWHSAMTGMSQLYENKRMRVLQSVGYANPILSHFRGTDVWNTATDSNIYANTGWVGRFLNLETPSPAVTTGNWPLAIQFGPALSNLFLAQTGGMGIALSQFPTASNPTGHNFDAIPSPHATQYDELTYIRTIQAETETYTNTIYSKVVQKNVQNAVTYPKTNIGTDLSNVAKLIVTQINDTDPNVSTKTKIFLVSLSGFDTHSNQITGQAKLLGDLSDALLAFQNDIEALKVADNVAVLTYSEFGRRPKENGTGTDHGTAAPHFVISTKVIHGVTGNDTNLNDSALVAGNLAFDPKHDFRNVYATMLNEWLLAGNDPTAINTDIKAVLTADSNATYSSTKSWSSLGIFQAAPPQDVASNSEGPGLMLMQNYPNPASKITTFEYALPATGPVMLSIYDSRGVEIERVVDARQDFGVQRASFDVSRLPAGPYLYRLQTSAGEVAREMIVVH
jgi:uncharacterized protein (DUF1501 family)